EGGAADSADPLAGSYLVERFTDEIEDAAEQLLAEIDRLGGGLRAVETGYYARQIEESAYAYQRAVEDGQKVIVGVNRFTGDTGAAISASKVALLHVDPAVRDRQTHRLEALRRQRDTRRVTAALQQLQACAGGKE